jgi:hypothetical protein
MSTDLSTQLAILRQRLKESQSINQQTQDPQDPEEEGLKVVKL